MKILAYKNLFIGITETLNNIFFNHKYADRELEKMLKSNKKWGSRDRAFIAETVYDTVRWKRMIEASMGKEVSPDNLWEFVGTWFSLNDEKLPYWDEFKKIDQREVLKKNHAATDRNFAVKASIPDWLNQLGMKELGKQWETEIDVMNVPSPAVIRTNTLKTDRKTLQRKLKEEGIESEILSKYPDALELAQKANIFKTEAFQNGWFEVQDAGSQLISPYLNVQPGMRVVDACAGAGGKALHLAALTENKGQIYGLDIHEWKLLELKKRAKRNGAQNIQTKVIDSSKVVKKMENTADRLLIDAPCSGLGVLSRNPDAKWKLSQEFIDSVKKEQAKILDEYCKIVKVSGAMVYATCSILPSENQNQVEIFLENHPEFKLVREKQLLPSQTGFDGFYMAYLERIS
ncbi:RsmB/NOP family class I SAM-dependent RNA methyltransferase [Moheibacter sediminis]|uniref:16S rRNA (Cytosine967-C5)-methyltransferase n=1 Tax=Moheibacter sediminis TaxID=1434700 RepID=A0A1W1ZBC2_9FLAO|nr:methyltransferase domain-containing protein [Moheibacter sediminis]SMC45572.1 16S rRNA (cytosine967-C5)-methyltransferase [Moheibacter sediminis]